MAMDNVQVYFSTPNDSGRTQLRLRLESEQGVSGSHWLRVALQLDQVRPGEYRCTLVKGVYYASNGRLVLIPTDIDL